MSRGIKYVLDGFLEVMFPKVCVCCTYRLAPGELSLCEFCKAERFESADSSTDGMPGEILPEYVVFRVALWQFDKGGILQDLLHLLKYEHLYDLGIDFGRQTGRIVRKRAASCGLEFCYQPLLVPVPLHKSQKRRRGYNQARAIAEGVAEMTGWAILGEGCVRRTSNTRTQTGLATGRRRSNVSGAFTADSVRFLPVELPVIIDDVYTTGATVMELALTLRKAGAQKIGIATLAEA